MFTLKYIFRYRCYTCLKSKIVFSVCIPMFIFLKYILQCINIEFLFYSIQSEYCAIKRFVKVVLPNVLDKVYSIFLSLFLSLDVSLTALLILSLCSHRAAPSCCVPVLTASLLSSHPHPLSLSPHLSLLHSPPLSPPVSPHPPFLPLPSPRLLLSYRMNSTPSSRPCCPMSAPLPTLGSTFRPASANTSRNTRNACPRKKSAQ